MKITARVYGWMIRAFPGLIVILMSVFPLMSQDAPKTGIIKGRVTDRETGRPLIGANVLVVSSQRGAATDAEGQFVIGHVPVGSYSVRFTYLGYETATRTDVIVRSSRMTFVNVDLKESVLEGEAVEVTAGYFTKPEEQPTSIASFTSEEIRRAPGSAGDVSRIIYGLPSVAKVNDTRNSLIVRGGSAVENGFYIDNIEINNINHFPEQGSTGGPIGMLNVDFIDDVNFYSGGFSALYGDRLSSIMELNFREGNRDEMDAQADLNFSGFSGQAEGPAFRGKGSWMASVRRSFLDFIVGAIGENTASVPQYGDIQAKVVYDLSPSHQLTLLNVGGLDFIQHKKDDAVEDKVNLYNQFQLLQNTIGLNWRSLWGKRGYSNTALSHAVADYDFSLFDTRYYMDTGAERSVMLQNSTEQEFRLRNINHVIFNDNLKLDFGVELKHMTVNFDNVYGIYNDFLGNPTPALTVRNQKSAVKTQGFTSISLLLFRKLTLTPGLRLGYFSANSNTTVSPRFAASVALTPATALNFSYGLYHQNLPLVLLEQKDGHRSMKDPVSQHLVLGLSHLLTDAARLTLEVYDKQYSHFPMDPSQPELFVIDEMNFTGLFLPHETLVDNGRANARGIELMIQKKLATHFYGMISAAYFRSRYRDYQGQWRSRVVDNRFVLNVEGGYKPSNRWEFSMRWIYAGGAPYTPLDEAASSAATRGIFDRNRINEGRLPDYHSLNVRFDRRFFFSKTNIVFYLSVWNAYGRENISSYYWNEIDNQKESQTQWSTLPIFGVEFEF
jgi:hypothetical protein